MAVLQKYYIRDLAPTLALKALVYTFHPNDFYKTLKRAVFKKFRGSSSSVGGSLCTSWGPNVQMKILSCLGFLLWLLAFLCMCVNGSRLMAVLAGIGLYVLIGYV